jgi:ABC-type transporter Mla MlaB component
MLRIQRQANGDFVFRISGRLNGENLAELRTLIESEAADQRIVLDLQGLTLVDSDAITFLAECDSNRITLQSCPRYVREWISRQKDGSDHEMTRVE